MEVPSITLIKELKLFGLQFYSDQVFVHSFSKSCDHSYVFLNDFKFSCLRQSSVFTQSMPLFFKDFIVLILLLKTHMVFPMKC